VSSSRAETLPFMGFFWNSCTCMLPAAGVAVGF
jgi:hypothetical protein